MKRCLERILAAFMAVFILVAACTPISYAVAPASFLYSAMFSYLSAAGFQFGVSNTNDYNNVVPLMENLYGQYTSTHSGAWSILDYAPVVSLSQLGTLVFGAAAVDQLSDFANWIASNFTLSPGGNAVNVVSSSGGSDYYIEDYSFLPYFLSGACTLPVSAIHTGTTYRENATRSDKYITPLTVYSFCYSISNLTYLCFCSLEPFTINYERYSWQNDEWTLTSTSTYTSGSNIMNHQTFYTYQLSANNTYYTSYDSPFNIYNSTSGDSAQVRNNYSYVILYGYQQTLIGNLSASLLSNVVDYANQVASDQSLVVDIGLGSQATEQSVVDAVVQSVTPALDRPLEITTSVVDTAVVDTPVMEYPDFDDLGLPELGLALVERFPFCIPYDFVHLVSLFDAEPVAPYIVIDLFPQSLRQKIGLQPGQAVFILDFTNENYALMGTIMRWGSLVGFCFALMGITKRLIWTS